MGTLSENKDASFHVSKTEFGIIGIIHADVPDDWRELKNLQVNEKSITSLIWQRRNLTVPSGKAIVNIDAVVHGHNSLERPAVINNQLWIDTLQKTGSLTILKDSEVFELTKGKD